MTPPRPSEPPEVRAAVEIERRRIIHWLRTEAEKHVSVAGTEAEKHVSVAAILQTLALRLECGEDLLLAALTEEYADTGDLPRTP